MKSNYPLNLPIELFLLNRDRLLNKLKQQVEPSSIVILKGGENVPHYSTDIDYLFIQDPYFYWLFGVTDPDYYGIIDIDSGKSTLLMPRLPEEFAIWMGKLKQTEEVKEKFKVDKVVYTDELEDLLKQLQPSVILTLDGVNTDSGRSVPQFEIPNQNKYKLNKKLLFECITDCRVIKTEYEIDALKKASEISCNAHRSVMLKVKPGMHEYQLESLFLHYGYYAGGCRHVAYTCICGTGENGAILHYGHAGAPNQKKIKDGDMCLLDMGASYRGYASDITCSYPANGKFTNKQKIIYNAVLAARNAVFGQLKTGVSWVKMHELANVTILTALKEAGLLKGNVEDMLMNGLAAIFMPHGLGHFMGLDVHDVGGYTPDSPARPSEPGFSKLRTARKLEAGMVITVEPGCYFIDCLLDRALSSDLRIFLVEEMINSYRGFGGVRIEDDVLITENGYLNLSANLPRTVEEIEDWMAESQRNPDAYNKFMREN